MGNAQAPDRWRGHFAWQRRSLRSGGGRGGGGGGGGGGREEKAVQCGILLPPRPQDVTRQTARHSAKMVQVGTRPSLRNRSTITEADSRAVTGSVQSSLRRMTPSPKAYFNQPQSEEKYQGTSNPFLHFQDAYRSSTMPYSDVTNGTCVFTTRQPFYFDMSKMRQAPDKWVYGASQLHDFGAFRPSLPPRKMEAGDMWQAPTPVDLFEPVKHLPATTRPQRIQIVDKPEIIPSPVVEGLSPRVLRKSRSWHGFPDQPASDGVSGMIAPQAVSMDTILLPPQTRRSSSLNPPPKPQTFPQPYPGVCDDASYLTTARCTMNSFVVPDANQSNQAYASTNAERMCTSTEFMPFYKSQCQCYGLPQFSGPAYFGPHTGLMVPAYSMANLGERSVRAMSHFSRANSMRSIKMGLMESERRRLMRLSLLNSSSGWSTPNSPLRGGASRQVCAPGEALEKAAKSPSRLKSVSFGQPSRFRFYLKESPQITKILLDTGDRRIRTICDRFQCDLEVYSKVPKSGFLQYAIDITAPDSTSLYACSRNLDSALGWFLTAQLTAARYTKC